MSELRYWIWLSQVAKPGPETAARLLERFSSPKEIFFADAEEYKGIENISRYEADRLANKDVSAANTIVDNCAEMGINLVTMQDAGYPFRLKNIYDPPMVLYIRGTLPAIDEEAAVAVVGPRKASQYGVRVAERLGYEITKSGGLIVSGLALGVDSAAALGALRAGGRVVGVVGSGHDIVYPPENKYLFEDVCASGAVVSEYPPGTEPKRENFPARNRIMSGLSVAVTVAEAPKRSGALITANLALEQGRELFIVPGNIDSAACEGSNALLRDCAQAVMSGWDILQGFETLFPEKLGRVPPGNLRKLDEKAETTLAGKVLKEESDVSSKKGIDNQDGTVYIDLKEQMQKLSEEELLIVSAITEKSMHVDDIIEVSGLPAASALAALTMLEINGYVTQEKGKRFSLNIKPSK